MTKHVAPLALLSALSFACALGSDPDEVESVQVTAEPLPDPDQPPAAAPIRVGENEVAETGSFAQFKDNELKACMDVTMVVTPPDPAPEEWAARAEGFRSEGLPEEIWSPMEQFDDLTAVGSCTQFQDRTVLGRCVSQYHFEVSEDEDQGSLTMHMERAYYRYDDVFGSDGPMRGCLQEEGDWWAIGRGSAAFERARRDHSMRQLEESQGQAQRALKRLQR